MALGLIADTAVQACEVLYHHWLTAANVRAMPSRDGTVHPGLRCRCFELTKNSRGQGCTLVRRLLSHRSCFTSLHWMIQCKLSAQRECGLCECCTRALVYTYIRAQSVVTGEVESQTILSRTTAVMASGALVQRCCCAHTAKQRSTQQTKGRKTQPSQRRRKAVPVVGLDIATAVPYCMSSTFGLRTTV